MLAACGKESPSPVAPLPLNGVPVCAPRPFTGSSGVLVTEIVEGGPADAAGLRVRDVILELGGSVVSSVDDLHRVLTQEAISHETTVSVLRNGQLMSLRVTPSERT